MKKFWKGFNLQTFCLQEKSSNDCMVNFIDQANLLFLVVGVSTMDKQKGWLINSFDFYQSITDVHSIREATKKKNSQQL